ncbi:MAG TPA: hypothetical protein VLT35_03595, partial [Methanocella sp.]|nr:hypothetical protein [Methanocella sp.]
SYDIPATGATDRDVSLTIALAGSFFFSCVNVAVVALRRASSRSSRSSREIRQRMPTQPKFS